jgi:hypothetical protein
MRTQAGQTATTALPMSVTAQEAGGQAVKQAPPLRIRTPQSPAIAEQLPARAATVLAKMMAASARAAEQLARTAVRSRTQALPMRQAPTVGRIRKLANHRAAGVPAPALRIAAPAPGRPVACWAFCSSRAWSASARGPTEGCRELPGADRPAWAWAVAVATSGTRPPWAARGAACGAITPSPYAFRLSRTPHGHAHALAHANR